MNAVPSLCRDDKGPPPRKTIDVRKVSGSDRFSIVVVSREVEGYWTHWFNKRTTPHIADKVMCPGCLALAPMRWAGFLHVCDPAIQGPGVFIELTALAKENLMIATLPQGMIRGQVLSVQRAKKNEKSPLTFDFLRRYEGSSLPAPADVTKLLHRIWRMPDVDGQQNGSAV